MIITIDGTAGSGKSTAATDLAAALGFDVMNTGAMYRATGYLLRQQGIDIDSPTVDLDAITQLIAPWTFALTSAQIWVNGQELTDVIAGEVNGRAASQVGKFKPVRRKLQAEQRRLVGTRNVVCEGRDQGSVVFPDAPIKFFFECSAEERARRRLSGDPTTEEYQRQLRILAEQLRNRDEEDAKRELDPLVIPEKAEKIETTNQDRETVLKTMLAVVEKWRSQNS